MDAVREIHGPSSIVPITFYHPDEPRHQLSADLYDENQRRVFSNLSKGSDTLSAVLNETGVPLRLIRGCIIIEMLLTDPQDLEHYIDPLKRDILIRKIKDFLVRERNREGLETDDIENMIVTIAKEDIAEAERFFQTGQ